MPNTSHKSCIHSVYSGLAHGDVFRLMMETASSVFVPSDSDTAGSAAQVVAVSDAGTTISFSCDIGFDLSEKKFAEPPIALKTSALLRLPLPPQDCGAESAIIHAGTYHDSLWSLQNQVRNTPLHMDSRLRTLTGHIWKNTTQVTARIDFFCNLIELIQEDAHQSVSFIDSLIIGKFTFNDITPPPPVTFRPAKAIYPE